MSVLWIFFGESLGRPCLARQVVAMLLGFLCQASFLSERVWRKLESLRDDIAGARQPHGSHGSPFLGCERQRQL